VRVIGLTGGIASGKSTVSKMLAELGATIIDADQIVHAIMEPHQPAWCEIIKHFGREILYPNDTIDRNALGNIIFQDKSAKKLLESIIHPLVKQVIAEQMESLAEMGCKSVVLDVPLLYEVGWQDIADEIWVVYVDPNIQIKRLMARNDLSYDEAMARIRSQMDLAEKAKLADVIIDNNTDIHTTRRQVLMKWKEAAAKAY
jgi:dephospho-CoA kinase